MNKKLLFGIAFLCVISAGVECGQLKDELLECFADGRCSEISEEDLDTGGYPDHAPEVSQDYYDEIEEEWIETNPIDSFELSRRYDFVGGGAAKTVMIMQEARTEKDSFEYFWDSFVE